MTKSTYTLHMAFAWVLLVALAFCAANYYLDLGFLSARSAKGLLILVVAVGVVWSAFFAPTRQEREEHRQARRAKKNQRG